LNKENSLMSSLEKLIERIIQLKKPFTGKTYVFNIKNSLSNHMQKDARVKSVK